MQRRHFLQGIVATSALGLLSPRRFAQAGDTLKVGYLHTLSADGHLWLGEHLGAWKAQGLQLDTVQFVTGLEAYQALAGGSIDLVTTGAVISNFPARGQGKAFLINALETGIAQIWADPDQGIHSLADLKGRQIATTRGTTAHFFLHRALKSVGLDSTKDVEIVHQRLDQAVISFIAGSVPATALWVPFDTPIRQRRPDSLLVAQSSDFPDATVVDGWSARNGLHASQPQLLQRFIRGWAKANDLLTGSPDEALAILAKDKYKEFDLAELKRQYALVQWYATAEWPQYYRDGSVQRWLNQVTDFNQEVGAIKEPIRAETYFDPKPFLDTFA
ncbi:ABC transporter substrate-binding protein [Azomonas macrocytogenes]|nr:ABC transporter substrate-binding protein [Azomonas macrocytogenes]